MDRGGKGDNIGGEHIMGADTIADAFDSAAADSKVKAILFRIDSPGGSPEASETIRRAMIHAQKKGKPVIVSMADVAASGGYWVAMNGDTIVADPGTLTGSIGVVAGKFVISGLMQKLGVTFQTLKTDEGAGMWSMNEEFSPQQRARVNAMLDDTYQTFIADVAAARKIPLEKMPDLAKGRVFTGAQAVKLGLVDQVGGYDVTLAAIRKKLSLGDDAQLALQVFPPPLTPAEKIMKLLKEAGVEGAMVRSAFIQFEGLEATLGPVLGDARALHGQISARTPTAALRLVQ
jgi:protease-4